MARKKQAPGYYPHTGADGRKRARTVLNSETVYLGDWDSPESREKHAAIVARWNAEQQVPPTPSVLTVADVVARFLVHAHETYDPAGHEAANFAMATRPLCRLFGELPASGLGTLQLEELQRIMASGSWMTAEERKRRRSPGWCRNTVNRQIDRIRTLWRWAEQRGLVPRGSHGHLRTLRRLPKNHRQVRHTKKRQPTARENLDLVLAQVGQTPCIGAMLELQWLVGMRSGEVRTMRRDQIDQSDPACWLYRPARHKGDWREDELPRVVPLGPECQRILAPWLLRAGPEDYLFPPAPQAKHPCYTVSSYCQAVRRACERAGVKILPYGGRHAAKMRITRAAGLDAARAVLGQKSISSTEHYAGLDLDHAIDAARKLA